MECQLLVERANGIAKPVSKQRDYGYTIGGPIGKPGGQNSLFFFYAHQFSPRTTGGAVNLFRVPTLLERQGDFSQSTDNTGALFPYIRDTSSAFTTCSAADTRAASRMAVSSGGFLRTGSTGSGSTF